MRASLTAGGQRCGQVFPLNLFSFSTQAPSEKSTTALYPTITKPEMSPEELILKKLLLFTASPSSATANSMLGEEELVRIPEYFCLVTTRADGHLACAHCWPPRYSAVRGPHSWGRLLSHQRSQIPGKVVFLCSHTAKTFSHPDKNQLAS